MLSEQTLVTVRNISDGPVVYTVPELNVRKEFSRGERKKVSVKELRALFYTTGGAVLLRDYLSIDNNELLDEFGIYAEPEYKWTEADVKEMLLNDSVERLMDCLDYAPAGIVELVKTLAVNLKINDMSKRQAIFEATGLDISKAIQINEMTADEALHPTKSSGRRVPVENTK